MLIGLKPDVLKSSSTLLLAHPESFFGLVAWKRKLFILLAGPCSGHLVIYNHPVRSNCGVIHDLVERYVG